MDVASRRLYYVGWVTRWGEVQSPGANRKVLKKEFGQSLRWEGSCSYLKGQAATPEEEKMTLGENVFQRFKGADHDNELEYRSNDFFLAKTSQLLCTREM